ncbi:MAG: hypothetical protein SFW67_36025 [Myxococcaceae bacterium]|nr:hypothetical protein [Myxococcaceae bacterium]
MRVWLVTSLVLAVACVRPKATPAPRPDCPLVPPLATTVEYELPDGRGARVEAGDGFVRPAGSTRWDFVASLYEPTWYEDAYEVVDCQILRRDDERRWPIRRSQRDDFEGTGDFLTRFGPDAGWTGVTLQSPTTPTIPSYVALRRCLFERTCDFRDNRFDLVEEPGRGRFVRATSVAKGSLVTAKASFESSLVYFIKGDVVTFRAKVRVVSGQPFSFFDLESGFISESPGPRVFLSRGRAGDEPPHLAVELKFLDKPTFEPAPGQLRAFPFGEWVDVEVELRLDDGPAGAVKIRQNGELVVDAQGQTLPLPDTVLDSLELGISATDVATVLDLDDVSISAAPRP